MKYDTIEDQLKYLRGRVSIYKKEVNSIAVDPSRGLSRYYRDTVQALEFYEKELAEVAARSDKINEQEFGHAYL